MFVKLVKVKKNDNKYVLETIVVNSEKVIKVLPINGIFSGLDESQTPLGLDKNHSFSEIHMQNGTNDEFCVVVGSVSSIKEKLNSRKKLLLD